MWDAKEGRCVVDNPGAHRGFVAALALGETSRVLVSAGDDRLVRMWDCR